MAKKKKGYETSVETPIIPKIEPKPPIVIPTDIVGKQVKHKLLEQVVMTTTSSGGLILAL